MLACVVVLLGVGLFVAGAFLPYYDVGDVGRFGSGSGTVSLYQQLSFGPNDGGSDLGLFLFLFGGVAPVAVVAAAAVVRSGLRAGAPMVLAAAVAAWGLTWIGVLLREATLLGGVSLEVGFWIQAVSIGVVIVGTLMAAGAARRGAHERGSHEGAATADHPATPDADR